jgi:hypothetical protein
LLAALHRLARVAGAAAVVARTAQARPNSSAEPPLRTSPPVPTQAASDVYSPVSGEVVAVGSAAASDPSLVNTDPFGSGWLLKVKLSDSSELDALLDATAYKAHIEEGGH